MFDAVDIVVGVAAIPPAPDIAMVAGTLVAPLVEVTGVAPVPAIAWAPAAAVVGAALDPPTIGCVLVLGACVFGGAAGCVVGAGMLVVVGTFIAGEAGAPATGLKPDVGNIVVPLLPQPRTSRGNTNTTDVLTV